jgi:methionine-rich copper-binding protein CopC/endonuclease YncB( thermonuclease family)
VAGSDLAADTQVTASVSMTDEAGNTATATDIQDYSVDTTAPTGTITLDTVTADNVINATEATATVAITGQVSGDVADGDTVTVTVNGTDYTGSVTSGAFSIEVAGSDLAADTQVTASVSMTDEVGNTATATDIQEYSVDTTAPTGTITLDTVTADNVINATEAAVTVAITGLVDGDVADGDTVTVTVNGTDYTGSVTSGAFSIEVAGSDLAADTQVTASVSMTDEVGNTATATDTKIYSIDNTTTATISLDTITSDNIINATESTQTITVTGSVGGDVKDGDTVTIRVNGTDYTGSVTSDAFSIEVAGSDLAADTIISASVTTTNTLGGSASATDSKTYDVDTAAPIAFIALDPDITLDDVIDADEYTQTIAITGTTSGETQDGDVVTITVNGVNYTGTTSGNAFSVDVAGSDLANDTTVTARLTATDVAGNSRTAIDREIYDVDIAATASIDLDANITADDIINIDESNSHIAITGTTGGDVMDGDTVTVTVNGIDYTGTVASGAFSIDVAGSDLAQDTRVSASVTATNNADQTATDTDSERYNVDTDISASISLNAIAGDNMLNAAEAISDVTVSGIVGGDVQEGDTVTITVNGSDYTTLVTGTIFSIDIAGSELVQDTQVTASVTATDNAGNSQSAVDTQHYSIDTVAPTVVISDDTGGTANGDVTFTFTFSEAVTGFNVSDVDVTGGTKATSFATGVDGDSEYTLVVTPASGSSTDIVVNINENVAQDLAGNGNLAATQNTQAVDTVLPSVAITDDTVGVATSDVTFTFTFSEGVADFDIDDITITGGSKGDFTATSSTEYSLVVIPNDKSTDDIVVTVAANVAHDAVGNGNTATTHTQAVNTAQPTTMISSIDLSADTGSSDSDFITNTEGQTITATLSTALVAGETLKGSVDGGSSFIDITNKVTGTAISWDGVTLSGTNEIQFKVTNNEGDGPVASQAFMIDATKPTANFTAATDDEGAITGTLSSGDGTDDTSLVLSGTNESGSTVEVFNDAVSLGQAVVTGTSWSYTATIADATTYQFNVVETDVAGNVSDPTTNFAVTGDTAAPTLFSSSPADDDTGVALNSNIVLTFNENIALGTGNITITDGAGDDHIIDVATDSNSELSIVDNVLTIDLNTDLANNATNYYVNIASTAITDLAGNPYAGISDATTLNFTSIPAGPSVSSIAISSATGIQNSTLNAGDVVSVTVTMSESATVDTGGGTPQLGLNIGGSTVQAGYSTGSGSTALVFTYTIQAGQTDLDGISIDSNQLTTNLGTIKNGSNVDFALTHNAVAANSSYKVDTTAPTANFGAATDNVGDVTGTLSAGDRTDDTSLVLSGTNESGATVEVFNGAVSLGQAVVTGTSWSYTAAVSNGTTYQFNVKETDSAGNVSAATSNFEVTGDTAAPTLFSSSPADGATGVAVGDNLTLTFNENIAIGTGNITIKDDTGSSDVVIDVTDNSQVTVSGSTLTINPTSALAASNDYHIEIANTAVTDTAGNAFAGIANVSTLNFTTAAPSSVVVFDLVEGVSSIHSGSRVFDSGTSYTIYIKVDSNSATLSTDGSSTLNNTATWGTWSGVGNLGADDKIIFTGDSALGILNLSGSHVTQAKFTFNYVGVLTSSSASGLQFNGNNGRVTRGYGGLTSVAIFTGGWTSANAGLTFNQMYTRQVPNTIMTSQGLA